MALFGAPIAHEDHGHRAYYSALHPVTEMGASGHAERLGREHGLKLEGTTRVA